MRVTAIRVSAFLLAMVSLAGLYLVWFSIAVTSDSGQVPLVVCVALLSTSPLLLARAPYSRGWSAGLAVLRWLGLIPFVIVLFIGIPGLVQLVLEGKSIHRHWGDLSLLVLCVAALLWPEIRCVALVRRRAS